MHMGIAKFFIDFLTQPGDLVFDPFAGSGTTCYVAEKGARKWIGCEMNEDYIKQAKIRLSDPMLKEKTNNRPTKASKNL